MRLNTHRKLILAGLAAMLGASAAAAQLLPPVGGVLRDVGRVGAGVLDTGADTVRRLGASAGELASLRVRRLEGLVRANRDLLEMTDLGPALRGEIIAVDPGEEVLAAATEEGFNIVREERIEGLDIASITLRPPDGMPLKKALARLRKIAPDGDFSANHLHFQSGQAPLAAMAPAALAQGSGGSAQIGIIDGGVAEHPALPGTAEQKGFASGAPAPNAHATAVASLAVGAGAVKGAAPRAHILVADIYGRDRAGGNSVALARALGWMAARRVPIVVVSLVGPRNALVAKAVRQAQARGMHIVAAVGNDGPSAPPAYPASYPGVIAVTGVDGRNRPLPEAGRAEHLDYSAPGADMAAAALGGRLARVRGTSYAAPLVAGRMAAALARGASPIAALNAEARDLGERGTDRKYGRGLVCGDCRTPL